MCPTIKPLSEDGFSLFQLDASVAPIDHERAERLQKPAVLPNKRQT